MPKLADYELANLATWCFDFETAFRLYSKTSEIYSEKQDFYGTIGALEGAIISQQLLSSRWKTPPDRVLERILGHDKYKFLQKETMDPRGKRFGDLVQDEQKKISERIEQHKDRLRHVSPKLKLQSDQEAIVVGPSTLEHGNWFIAVQRLSSFCLGRMYRRDAMVPDLSRVSDLCASGGMANDLVDMRFISLTIDEIPVEIWFDGRISSVGSPTQFDRLTPTFKIIADLCDKVIAEGGVPPNHSSSSLP